MAVRNIEDFKKQFAIGKRRRALLSEKEINDRRQTQLRALLASITPK